jgi:hypothetical protein
MVVCNGYWRDCLFNDLSLLFILICTFIVANKKVILFLIVVLIFINNASIFAQCAMCKSTATSDLEGGGTIATGLNTGIFYLMAIPYFILMIGGYFFFKKSVDAKVKSWKNRLFSSK